MGLIKKKAVTMPKEFQDKCHAIIHPAAVAAGGVGTGLAQIPLADNAVITPIQIGMIIGLGKVFDQKITEAAARAILSSLAASFIGRSISQVVFGWVPGLGNAINTATAAGLTELIGWTAAEQFYQNKLKGTFDHTEENGSTNFNEAGDTDDEDDPYVERAMEFISGDKTVDSNRKEYEQLLSEIENELLNRAPNDPLQNFYQALINLDI